MLKHFFSHSAEKFRGGTIQSFRNYRLLKSYAHKKGISLFPVEFFFHWASKFRGGTNQCFRNIQVSKHFMHRRGHLGIVENFLFQRTEKLLKESLLCFRYFRARKQLWLSVGRINFFRWNFFYLTVPEGFVGEPIIVSEKFG